MESEFNKEVLCMSAKTVKRSFDIYEAQDTELNEWAEKIPEINKSVIVRIVLQLGLADFRESEITKSLVGGQLGMRVEDLITRGERGRRKSSVRRRSK